MKDRGHGRPTGGFLPIHMPRNTGAGVIMSGLALVLGFAMVWYIWWLAIASFIGIVGFAIWHTFNYDREFHLPMDEVIRAENGRTRLLAAGN
jgi:cytochrome o ubiquinol oxidase subunit 1